MKNSIEVLNQNIKETFSRTLLVVGLGLGALTLASCATGDPIPNSDESIDVNKVKVFEYPEVIDGQGDPLKCLSDKGSRTSGYKGYAWESMSCDFTGLATFPGETPPEE